MKATIQKEGQGIFFKYLITRAIQKIQIIKHPPVLAFCICPVCNIFLKCVMQFKTLLVMNSKMFSVETVNCTKYLMA